MKKLLIILLFPICFSATAQDKSIQLTGILVSTDSLLTIPFANVLIKNTSKGTISDFATTSDITVRRLSDGGQSMKI